VTFGVTRFSGGRLTFDGAEFSCGGVRFGGNKFCGGTADVTGADDWSFPPAFPWTDTPPPIVKLPRKEDQAQA